MPRAAINIQSVNSIKEESLKSNASDNLSEIYHVEFEKEYIRSIQNN